MADRRGQEGSICFDPRNTYHRTSLSPPRTNLLRVYSENEKANFDQVTGSRRYDDDRHRPIPSGEDPAWRLNSKQRRHSTNAEEGRKNFSEMQDEYIPEIDFADEVAKWLGGEASSSSASSWEQSSMSFHNPWLESSIDSSHAQVGPIPLPSVLSKSNPVLAPVMTSPHAEHELANKGKFARSASLSPSFGEISSSALEELNMKPEELTELLDSLPPDFFSLAYSQRKKFLVDRLPTMDHKTIMSWLKRIMLTTSKTGTPLRHRRGSAAVARSRHGSIASQYLNSFSPSNMTDNSKSLGSAGSSRPDDKGMIVLGHRLGKIIGFGAWGMIRECVDVINGEMRAMKIVRFKNNNKVKMQVLREVHIWQGLDHENILKLWKWKLEDNYALYCLTDKINNGTFYDLVISWGEIESTKINKKYRCEMCISLCLQVINALKYMHSSCIAHGDVKLENCLLEKEEDDPDNKKIKVVLCDFGMSTYFDSFTNLQPKAVHYDRSNLDRSDVNYRHPLKLNSAADIEELTNYKQRTFLKSRLSVSSANDGRHASRLQRIIKSRRLAHDNMPVGVSSLPKTYGPALSSTHIVSGPSTLHHLVSPAIGLTPTMDVAALHSGTDALEGPDPHSHIGSLPYAAPELLDASPPPLDPSTDVWALGVMIYAMLTGKLPFKHDFEPRLRTMIISGKFDRGPLEMATIKEIQRDFKGLYRAVLGCLTHDVTARWSLSMIQEALENDIRI